MVGCSSFKSKVWRYVQLVFCAFVVFSCLCQNAYASENTDELPIITKWVNGIAVSENGTYLYDTWAVDNTGISDKKYVLVNQNYEEALRIKNYPEDMTDGDTKPCEKFSFSASLDVSNDVSGDIHITLENEFAEYLVTFSENSSYKSELVIYPGVYEVTDVEVTGDLIGKYRVSNYSQIDVSSDLSVSLKVTKDGASGENAAGEPSDNTAASDNQPASDVSEDNNELLEDTIKLVIAVAVLFSIYAVIKYRRSKSEEIKQ